MLQEIFAEVSVRPSANAGLLGDTECIAVSGGRTFINSGGSPFGIKVCDCKSKGIFNYHCHRRFSGPQARHGWDIYHEQWFYGHCDYSLSIYNRDLELDLRFRLKCIIVFLRS